jgi:DNA-directed RNA polymerase III subunit RPC3
VEGIVRERFGSKCLRVFRLLLVKRVLEQKQVVDMAMIPSKEARELLYSLLAENFISLQEIPRTMDYAPSRTFYLFSVNLPSVARLLLERTYQALGNIVSCRMFEMKTHK